MLVNGDIAKPEELGKIPDESITLKFENFPPDETQSYNKALRILAEKKYCPIFKIDEYGFEVIDMSAVSHTDGMTGEGLFYEENGRLRSLYWNCESTVPGGWLEVYLSRQELKQLAVEAEESREKILEEERQRRANQEENYKRWIKSTEGVLERVPIEA